MKDGERRPQSNSGEYDWLGPDLTRNKRGQLYPYIPSGLSYSNQVWYVTGPKVGIKLPPPFGG